MAAMSCRTPAPHRQVARLKSITRLEVLSRDTVHDDTQAAHRDGLVDQVQALVVGADVGREAALVAHVSRVLTVFFLDDALQRVVHLRAGLRGAT